MLTLPLPREDVHLWTGIVGEREQDCLICGAKGMDRDISDAEIERDREMSAEYDKLHEKYFGKDDEIQ